jgi:hypothetical protein
MYIYLGFGVVACTIPLFGRGGRGVKGSVYGEGVVKVNLEGKLW